MVPGHEIIGTVSAVGKDVKHFKVGDTAGVGVIIGSCRNCSACKQTSSNIAKSELPSPTTLATSTANSSRAATPTTSSATSTSPTTSPATSTWPQPRPCSAPESPPTPPPPLGRHQRQKSRRRRTRRPRPHGPEIRPLLRRSRRPVHHLARASVTTHSASAPTKSSSPKTPTPWPSIRQFLRLHPRHRLRAARHQSLPQRAQARRHPVQCRNPRRAFPGPTLPSPSIAAPSPAPPSAA